MAVMEPAERRVLPVTRIVSLAILFVALTEFGIERARFDLWIMTAALVALLWNILGRRRRFRVESQKHDHTTSMTKSEPSQIEQLRSDSSLSEVIMQRKPTSEKEIDRLSYAAMKNPHLTT